MSKIVANNHISLRFRRWSRKGYALFVSMTCAVTIGVLAVSVSEKSVDKNTTSKSGASSQLFAENCESECPPEEIDNSIQEQNNFIITSNDDAAACGLQLSFIKNQTVDSGIKARINRFFILCELVSSIY